MLPAGLDGASERESTRREPTMVLKRRRNGEGNDANR